MTLTHSFVAAGTSALGFLATKVAGENLPKEWERMLEGGFAVVCIALLSYAVRILWKENKSQRAKIDQMHRDVITTLRNDLDRGNRSREEMVRVLKQKDS